MAFRDLHGRVPVGRPIELAAIRVFAGDPDPPPTPASVAPDAVLAPGASADGPRLLPFDAATCFIAEGWTATGTADGGVLLERRSDPIPIAIDGPAATEIVACRLESIARDMGETLRRTALSVNVKERLDYSCGIVDAHGRLVVNAPHMPVHLGAMGDCVRRVLEVLDPDPGDTVLVNHPGFGGSHLPDLTLVTPVHAGDGRRIGFVVNRAHHAEIGGTRPGSMPPDATRLVEEGVVFPDADRRRRPRPPRRRRNAMLREAPHPSRSVEENLADLEAQLSANRLGRPGDLTRRSGGDLASDLDALRDRCDAAVADRRTPSRRRSDGRGTARRRDADGCVLVGEDRMRLDFAGSGPVHPGNLNAPSRWSGPR